MKTLIPVLLLSVALSASCGSSPKVIEKQENRTTYCNPMDLSYQFAIEKSASRREAADPTVIKHRGTYYLFASKSGGYWHSTDLITWELIRTNEIPAEDYAPTAISMRDTVFFMASSAPDKPNKIYKSADPKSGKWELACDGIALGAWDPCLYQDDDERLYFYWGCSNKKPMYGVEMNPYTFEFIGEPKELITSDYMNRGWEISGDYNTNKELTPWIEGAWINKHNGKYYQQYAAPDARFKSYCDAVVVADSPLGEYKLAPHNAFAYKPEGFACGAGHGSTFEDDYGNLWHVGTVSISVKHTMERRLALYPTFFDDKGNLYMHARFGDYPTRIPSKKLSSPEEFETGWMLLSYDKDVTVSSTLEGHPATNIVNEDIRSYWSAESGNEGEWAIVDLGDICDVNAMQVNFAENMTKIFGRKEGIAHKYLVESSIDGENWQVVDDQRLSTSDNTNNYVEFKESFVSRYVRVTNYAVPDGTFAVSGIRVFGHGRGDAPTAVSNFVATRNADDRRDVTLQWDNVEESTGYNIRYGVAEDMLYHNHIVYGDNKLTIRSLDANQSYCFKIESFSENGVSVQSETYFVK